MKESLPGNKTISHYRILHQLGAGGMGEVYLAQDTRLDRKVAIKFLPAELAADERATRRLIREAQAAAALDHSNICSIYEVGEEDGLSFIVMQYIEGASLASRITAKALGLREALDIAVQIADALAEAHSRSLIHRDIKPQNIMITVRGQVKVLDFGLAKVVRERDMLESEVATQGLVTEPGMIVGTVPYMSPEQVKGEPLDARSDIFSFGAVLYEMVTGHQPFASENAAATISAILVHEPAPLARYSREAPAELERIVTKALAKDREERYQTAKDAAIDLRKLNQRIEIEAELQRSKEPEGTGGLSVATIAREVLTETAGEPATPTAETAAARSTSSAEYLITEIRRHKKGLSIALAAFVITLAAIAYFLLVRGGQPKTIDSLAVLPFLNASTDPDTEYLSDGITESLINSLSQLPNLKVMSRNSIFRYKGRESDAQAAARELNVRAVLTGRVVRHSDALMISVELVDALDNSHIWGDQYVRKFEDILRVQREIAREVSEKLQVRLTGLYKERLRDHQTENTEAYQLYLKGRYYANKYSTDAIKKSIEFYEQAIKTDPKYALAYAGLAESYFEASVVYLRHDEAFQKARLAALKALQLDETLAEAHTSLALVNMNYDWDWPEAEKHCKRAIELKPGYAWAHDWYGIYLGWTGHLDEAKAELKQAQDLDPLSLPINTDLAGMYFWARQYDQAIELYRKTLDLDPTFTPALGYLGWCYEQ
ncbi:MAG: hypothetical protein DMF60_09670, partial [Acidobacteria bacterium]